MTAEAPSVASPARKRSQGRKPGTEPKSASTGFVASTYRFCPERLVTFTVLGAPVPQVSPGTLRSGWG